MAFSRSPAWSHSFSVDFHLFPQVIGLFSPLTQYFLNLFSCQLLSAISLAFSVSPATYPLAFLFSVLCLSHTVIQRAAKERRQWRLGESLAWSREASTSSLLQRCLCPFLRVQINPLKKSLYTQNIS